MKSTIKIFIFAYIFIAYNFSFTQNLKLNIKSLSPYYSYGNNDEVYFEVELLASEIVPTTQRLPLNISIVIDRSGSMHGEKLLNAKNAAIFVVNQLKVEDYISIVSYESGVNVDVISTKVKDKNIIISKINNIKDQGGTNLSGGMLKAYDEVKINKKENYINKVLLMTDGLANEGIIDPNQLCIITKKKCIEEGITLSTFGIGLNYNEDLLTRMSIDGCGNYYFIKDADKIPEIFSNELDGLLKVVAQNIKVKVKFDDEYLKYNRTIFFNSTSTNNEVITELSDIFSKGTIKLIIGFNKKDIKNLNQLKFSTELTYFDVETQNNILDIKDLHILYEVDTLKVNMTSDSALDETIALYDINQLEDQILIELKNNNIQKAKELNELTVNKSNMKLKSGKDSIKMKLKSVELNETEQDIENYSILNNESKGTYIKESKQKVYKNKKMKY